MSKKQLFLGIILFILSLAIGVYLNLISAVFFINYGSYMHENYTDLYWISIIVDFLCMMIYCFVIKNLFDYLWKDIKEKYKS
ncbi:hypothetical protein [Mammaliicoccus sciuri]|uniref:hypothetical protein n=1 Tax=Mammaliicoccus sciuri TaxID=1296 RepID=UPI000E6A49D4|nr:hypothetical protein [Mammaliicoccus sciuri]RIN97102.1 hypothetical protein BU002_01945 [Mammaliicoccus sciuri]